MPRIKFTAFLMSLLVLLGLLSGTAWAVYSGQFLWAKRYTGPNSGDEEPSGMAISRGGYIYVTGSSWGGLSDYDFATVKYDSAGNQMWVRRFNGSANSTDKATSIAVDVNGNVYVTGTSAGSTKWLDEQDFDYLTIKYDSAGNRIWTRRYDGPGHKEDSPVAIATDALGNVYVTGSSAGPAVSIYGDLHWFPHDYATIKYDAWGNIKWIRRFTRSVDSFEVAHSMAINSAGLVIAGESGLDGDDYATVKYDQNGNLKWSRYYDGASVGDSGDDAATAVTLDATGNTYVTGTSDAYHGYLTSPDYVTIKYNQSGDSVWTRRYDGPGHGDDTPRSIAVDAAGGVYVTGGSNLTSTPDRKFATIKYDSLGTRKWIRYHGGSMDYEDGGKSLVLDASANVYVTGSQAADYLHSDVVTAKYSSAGTLMWSRIYESVSLYPPAAILLSNDGSLYVTGSSLDSNNNEDFLTLKYAK